MNKYKSGFCGAGQHEGTKPRSWTGKPMPICTMYEDCPCECHVQVTKMFEMVGMERLAPEQSAEYMAMIEAEHIKSQAMLADVRRMTIAAKATGADIPRMAKDAAADGIAAVVRPMKRAFGFTPTGQRERGALEADVLQVCEDWAAGAYEDEDVTSCTPKFVGEQIAKMHSIEAPSSGAIQAVWDRWMAIRFALYSKSPVQFMAFAVKPGEFGLAYQLEELKTKHKREKKQAGMAEKLGRNWSLKQRQIKRN